MFDPLTSVCQWKSLNRVCLCQLPTLLGGVDIKSQPEIKTKWQLWFFINFHKHDHVKIKGDPVGIKCQEIERGAIPDLIIY